MQLSSPGDEDPCQLVVRTHPIKQDARADAGHVDKEIQSDIHVLPLSDVCEANHRGSQIYILR